jgi:hypothetical protein
MKKVEDLMPNSQATNHTSILAWIELICVILLNMSINLRWLTFSPVATIASQYMDVNMSSITWLANCATLIYIGISASTGWVFERYGMKACVSIKKKCRHIIQLSKSGEGGLLVLVGSRYQYFRVLD